MKLPKGFTFPDDRNLVKLAKFAAAAHEKSGALVLQAGMKPAPMEVAYGVLVELIFERILDIDAGSPFMYSN